MDEHELISGVLQPGLERTGTLVVVPARMASTRLPGKPLADIGGVPMIVQVWRRAVAAEIGPVVVACAEREIAAAVERYGGIAVLTDPKHPSGSDRIHEALNVCDPKGLARIIVNVQGDLPTLDPTLIRRVLDPLSVPEVDISTLVCPITDPEEGLRSSVVKAAVAWSKQRPGIGRALYFSRATIPWGPGVLLHHIGLYAYRRAALKKFVALPPGAIEQRENLEQLRALEAGMRIDVAEVATIPLGVDTPEDLVTARRLLAAQKGSV